MRVTVTWRNDNPNTVWNRLAARLGREPTATEAETEVKRIIREARATGGPLEAVDGRYGAPMGRVQTATLPAPEKTQLQRVRLNSGGYDSGGAYWGLGEPLWLYSGADGWSHIRARDRAAAKAKIRERYPDATFYR